MSSGADYFPNLLLTQLVEISYPVFHYAALSTVTQGKKHSINQHRVQRDEVMKNVTLKRYKF